jgi:hypothetical protein
MPNLADLAVADQAVLRPDRGDAAASGIFPAVASDSGDDRGVMGNLPRERPGRRSTKRGSSARQPAAGATASRAGTSARTAATVRKRQAPKRERPASPPPPPDQGGGLPDPIGEAVKLAGKVAGFGFKTAGEILKRLPGR